jgi:hypothetical protein
LPLVLTVVPRSPARVDPMLQVVVKVLMICWRRRLEELVLLLILIVGLGMLLVLLLIEERRHLWIESARIVWDSLRR